MTSPMSRSLALWNRLRHKRDKKILIRVRVSTLTGAIQALDHIAEQCMLSDDEHARMIDASYWSNDYYDLLNTVEKRTRFWRRSKEMKMLDKARKDANA